MGATLELPQFAFQVSRSQCEAYRASIGSSGASLLLAMATRSLSHETVVAALRMVSGGRIPVHASQDCRVVEPLRAEVEYRCRVRMVQLTDDRLTIELELEDGNGLVCLYQTSELALVPE